MMHLDGCWKIKLMFPELTDLQFRVLMLYSLGSDIDTITDILKCSKNAVKMALRRIKEKFNVEKLETVRAIYHSRTSTAMMASDEFLHDLFNIISKRNPAE